MRRSSGKWLLERAAGVRTGRLSVLLPDGRELRCGGAAPGPEAVLRIRRERLARRVLIGGALGFCEAYLDGDWSSPDLEALFTVLLLNEAPLHAAMPGGRWFRAAHQLLRSLDANTRRGARRHAAHHYDLGNAFFAAWLDPTMTYSAALFPDDEGEGEAAGEAELAAAQRRKYAAMAELAALAPGHRLLEIGCGWGGFAEFAARERGARVTAVTLSRAQVEHARRRVADAGLAGRVEIRRQDYREITGCYDRIVAIEMVEAVGERYWPAFFAMLCDRLVPGGRAALQVITIDDRLFPLYRHGTDYIRRHIFPGGMLPSPGMLHRLAAQAGLEPWMTAGLGPHYARTLRAWHRRFQAAWPEIERMGFDARFKRRWEQYLLYCAAGFRTGRLDLLHLALRKPYL